MLNGDGDLGRHITIGNYILEHASIPTRDIFSHSLTGKPLVPHEWLAEVMFASAHRLFGLNGVVILSGLIIATSFLLVYRRITVRGVFHLIALLVASWAALASFLHWLARPHIFTFLFVAIWMVTLDQAIMKKPFKIWVPPLIMLVWANTHGAYIAGFIILGAYLAGWVWEHWKDRSEMETGKYLAASGILSILVTLLNPAGWRLWVTSIGYIGERFLVNMTIEYQSPDFHSPNTWPFLFLLVAGILLLGRMKELRPHELLLLAGWSALGLYSSRHIPLYAIITAPYFGTLSQPIFQNSNLADRINNILIKTESQLRGAFIPALAVFIVILSLGSGNSLEPLKRANIYDPSRFPVEAADWLIQNPQKGNMFNEFIWGGYLLYRLWPEHLVFIDGQTDFYGETLTREYTQVISMEGNWQNVIGKYYITWAILPIGRPLVQELQNKLGWQVVYQDDTSAIIREPQ